MRLDRLAASAADLFQPLAEEKGVVIRVEAAPVSVLGVRTLLQRAVTNLVDNAVKFSPRDRVVTLAVRLDQGKPVLAVADQGPGLDPELLDDPRGFQSGWAGPREPPHGSGLRARDPQAARRGHDD